MTSIASFTTHLPTTFASFRASAEEAINNYFDYRSSSPWVTALKVISYATLIIPALVLALKLVLVCTRCICKTKAQRAASVEDDTPTKVARAAERLAEDTAAPEKASKSRLNPIRALLPKKLAAVLDKTPPFRHYRIGQGTPYEGTNLTAVTARPANLFFEALLGENSTTLPGSESAFFEFRRPHAWIRDYIMKADPNRVIEFTASGKRGAIQTSRPNQRTEIGDLGQLYGTATCRFSFGELQSTLQSQKIYTCPLLPIPFFRALQTAMFKDGITELPGRNERSPTLSNLATTHCKALVASVSKQWAKYGFKDASACQRLLDLTLYQLGSLVVKTEDTQLLLGSDGKIRARKPGERDAIRLISACGIRDIRQTPPDVNATILRQMFGAVLHSAGEGFLVVPALGMGVWGGDPGVYWKAFFDAVCQETGKLEKIFVNPGHQTTGTGDYRGCNGNEFQTFLDKYRARVEKKGDQKAMHNLAKVENLFTRKTDLLQLSHQLKVAFPKKTVSLVNASDPDVMGDCVGEYVNHLDHAPTTEENFAAQTTMCLCFKRITGVLEDESRLIQV